MDRSSTENMAPFERLYYGLRLEGCLAGCAPIIRLDGCSLKSLFDIAMGSDGIVNIFPIALVVIEAEMYDSWS